MNHQTLRNEVLDSIDVLESALCLEAARDAMECLSVQVPFADAWLLYPVADSARLRIAARKLREYRDGNRRLPPVRVASLAPTIISLHPDTVTWNQSDIRWTGEMRRILGDGPFNMPVGANDPVRVQVEGADRQQAVRRITWVLQSLGVPE